MLAGIVVRIPGSFAGQFVRKVVEGTTQVVDNIPDDDSEMERWLFGDLECDSWFAVARIALHQHTVRAVVNVSGGFVVKGYEMMIGTPEFWRLLQRADGDSWRTIKASNDWQWNRGLPGGGDFFSDLGILVGI